MLKTLNEWRDDANDLIRRYGAWRRADVDKILKKRNGAPATRRELEILSDDAGQMAAQARALLASDDAQATTNADFVEDLTSIAEELEAFSDEGKAAADPDAAFASADRVTRERLTVNIPVAKDKADRLRARARGELRQPKAPNPNSLPSDTTPGNGNGKPK